MNIDTSVTSKYFSKNSMDESLSEFQEAKQSCKGPKTVNKPSKIKPKKATKRIKGQKDIRTAIKGKKNELISYSKEFDNVCKQAGVGIDSEQLQLAIALSKSLQTDPETTERSQPLSSQERVGKIRTTLLEYGFKVPEIKITTNKRIKKHRRQYKLLLTTEAERSQVISERYMKILFENLESKSHENYESDLNSDAKLFHISTHASYESIRDDSIFYINNLVEKTVRIGSLLRNWSDIPGRPISPKLFEINTMDFNKIDCSQNELDVILSSSIKTAQRIINSKEIMKVKYNTDLPAVKVDFEPSEGKSDDNNGATIKPYLIHEKHIQRNETVTQYYRSCSPDIFDDEVSSIMDNTVNTNIQSQEHKTKVFTEDVMELTECANTLSQNYNKPQLSQNATKRKSNDFMEITDCIVTSSQPILENHDNIDLTQSPDMKETSIGSDRPSLTEISIEMVPNNIDIESIDLTQPLDSGYFPESLKKVTVLNTEVKEIEESRDNQSPKHNIDLTQSSNDEDKTATVLNNNNEVSDPNLDTMDLTQSSNSSDDLPFVRLTDKIEDTVILDENAYLDNGRVMCSTLPSEKETLDLTQEVNNKSIMETYSSISVERPSKSRDQSIFDESIHDNSESIENYINEPYKTQSHSDGDDESDIDLTQDSDSSSKINNSHSNSVTPQKCTNSFGNENDISTDYDEICNNLTPRKTTTIVCDDYITEIKDTSDNVNSNNDLSSSQSTAFDISDKELDYSLHKSRHDVPYNFDFGGISILDNVTKVNHANFQEDSTIINNRNHDISDSFLPEVNVRNKQSSQTNSCDISPHKSSNAIVTIVTPSNDYTVKTDEVTPMLDFASLTTPQRNRELDRYGLKPFKRKRAIQLLTHLYNQTHPIVEPFGSEEQPSPSKKQKKQQPMSPENVLKSPAKSLTPRQVGSPKENNGIECANDNVCSYEVTSEVPAVRSIECNPEEWIFQKREKTKVYSCRVPLHIAFHNYVSSRRELREAILKYEPVNIDVVHKELVGYGHRYDPKDLLRFLDKKCITVKTTDNNTRHNNR